MTTTDPPIARIYPDIPEDIYHTGTWLPEPSLSVTAAKRLLQTSPARWKWEQENPTTKKAFDFGSAAHKKVLGIGTPVATIPGNLLAKNGAASTDRAKAWIAEQREAGVIPLKAEEMAVVDAMAFALTHHDVAKELLSDGAAEQSFAYRDPDTGGLLRGRADWIATYRGTPVVADYKTCRDSNPNEFRWDMKKYSHEMQDSWYRELLDAITGTPHGFLFIAQEKEPPYLVSVIQLGSHDRRAGHEKNQYARQIWHNCTTTNKWPAYPGITTVTIP